MSAQPFNNGPFPPLPELTHPGQLSGSLSTAAVQRVEQARHQEYLQQRHETLIHANEHAAAELAHLRRQLVDAEKRVAGEGVDPWKHRAKGMKCGTCMWFVAKKPSVLAPQVAQPRILGRCRRHAPTMSGYPVVFFEDWCGDHRLDEEKI